MLVLNALWEAGERTIPIEHPCPEVGELLRFELDADGNATVSLRAGIEEYRSRCEAVRLQYDEAASDDLPDAHEYVRALTFSGIVELENRAEIDSYVKTHATPDLEAGHPPVFAGIDQNIFWWHVGELLGIDPELPQYEYNRPPVNGYALSAGVKEELDWFYRQQHTDQVIEAFGEEFANLANQPAGDRRRGYLGLYEYRRLRANRRSDIVHGDTGDANIVDAYAQYHQNDDGIQKNVVLFSNDYGFIERAHDRQIPAVHVNFRRRLPLGVSVSWDTLRDALYVLAVFFGVIKLPRVTLYGVWDGKTGRHWSSEQLFADVRSPVVEPILQRKKSVVEAYQR